MLLASIYALMRFVLGVAILLARSQAERDLELLALRHQVAILSRQVRRPELVPADRLILAAVGRGLPAGRLLFSPSTLMRWHRELVRRRWATFSRRPRRGRPPISEELRALIVGMASENPRWGERRIQGELLKLGHRVSNSTIRVLLRRHRLGPAPRRSGLSWSQFDGQLRAHVGYVHGHRFGYLRAAGRPTPARLEDRGSGSVAALLHQPVDRQLEPAAVLGVDQEAEHGIGVEAGNAKPVDRASTRHQCRASSVAEQPVFADGWLLGHAPLTRPRLSVPRARPKTLSAAPSSAGNAPSFECAFLSKSVPAVHTLDSKGLHMSDRIVTLESAGRKWADLC